MEKTTVELYTLVKYQFPSQDRILKYVRNRNESVTCTKRGLSYIINHMRQTVEHRKWLYYAFVLVADSFTYRDREKLHELVLNHDLSKFSATEAIGYGYKFGRKNVNSVELKNPKHIAMWEDALKHHHINNAHHPEHTPHCPLSFFVLIESVLDLLACRMGKKLAGKLDSTPNDIFDIPPMYIERYVPNDRERIKDLLSTWCTDVTSTSHRYSLAKNMLM